MLSSQPSGIIYIYIKKLFVLLTGWVFKIRVKSGHHEDLEISRGMLPAYRAMSHEVVFPCGARGNILKDTYHLSA